MMHPIAKSLIILGVIFIFAGLFWHFGGKYIGLGRLPGDVQVEKEGFRFYFPIVTCLIISVVLSLVLSFIKK